MQISIALTARDAARIEREIARLQQAGDADLTAEAFVARMTLKLVRGWLTQDDQQIEAANATVLQATARALADDPSASDKLAPLGLTIAPGGSLTTVAKARA